MMMIGGGNGVVSNRRWSRHSSRQAGTPRRQARGRARTEHECFGLAPEVRLQVVRELRVTERHVPLTVRQLADAHPEVGQRPVDGDGLCLAITLGARLLELLRPGLSAAQRIPPQKAERVSPPSIDIYGPQGMGG